MECQLDCSVGCVVEVHVGIQSQNRVDVKSKSSFLFSLSLLADGEDSCQLENAQNLPVIQLSIERQTGFVLLDPKCGDRNCNQSKEHKPRNEFT